MDKLLKIIAIVTVASVLVAVISMAIILALTAYRDVRDLFRREPKAAQPPKEEEDEKMQVVRS